MSEQVRWVSKAEAADEIEVSMSTLDRMIRRGEVEVRREGRRVYVRMEGPEYVSDEELLRRSLAREEELQRTVRELERSLSEWQLRASELERERDEAQESAANANRPYYELEREHRKEVAEHKETKEVLGPTGLGITRSGAGVPLNCGLILPNPCGPPQGLARSSSFPGEGPKHLLGLCQEKCGGHGFKFQMV